MVEGKDLSVEKRISELNSKELTYEGYKRGNSWGHCHDAFVACAKQPYDEINFDSLALHLAFYLASWGMYRGSSFLLDMDYRIHRKPVEMMMSDPYKALFNIENPFASEETTAQYKRLLFGDKEIRGIYGELEKYYLDAHREIFKKRQERKGREEISTPGAESDTLLTKILLGVYGCIPAYDRYFKRGVSLFERQQLLRNDGNALFKGSKSLGELLKSGAMREALEQYHKEYPQYTFMKVVDMYFFSLGVYFEEGYDKLSSDEKKDRTQRFKDEIRKIYPQ